MYRLLTEGQIEPGHAEQPPALPASLAADAAIKAQPGAAPLMDMPLRVEPMKSAYAAALGREPELTNNARTVRELRWGLSSASACGGTRERGSQA